MSSVPMAGPGSIAGLGWIGCESKSRQATPRSAAPSDEPSRLHSPTIEVDTPAQSAVQSIQSQSEEPSDCGTPRVPTAPHFGPLNMTTGAPKSSNGALHRVRMVREQQGLSLRSAAKRVGVDVRVYKNMEEPSNDLSLSELRAIQAAFDVPLIDLLEDSHSLSRPVEERAKLVKIMKTAAAMREMKSNPRVERLSQMLTEQLIELMPELADVGGWPQFGARRGQSALGKALSQPVDTSQLGLSE